MEGGSPAERAIALLRSRLCDPSFIFSFSMNSPDSNYRSLALSFSKLKFIISSSITESCNNSMLLLGPRGCGKNAVLELVLRDLLMEYPDMISLVKLNGLLHSDDNCALKEIARQLCLEHQLIFSKMASFDDNSQFVIAMLRECGLAHKTIIFVLDEFDLFTQGKQRLLYSLLDALQSLTSQAVVIGICCRLDADQLLEKRVRSRFSHRKLLFVPPKRGDLQRFLEHVLYLPKDSIFPRKYVVDFNSNLQKLLTDPKFIDILNSLSNFDNSVSHLTRFLFHAVSSMNLESGILSLENFVTASQCIHRQPKLEILQDASVLELYMLVCMNRLEVKEQNSYNFNSIMKEYKAVHDTYQTSDHYAHSVCLRAFEHLLERELVGFVDGRVQTHFIEFRPVKLLISPQELNQGLRLNRSCPAILLKLLDREAYK